jgi:hypothetical protein
MTITWLVSAVIIDQVAVYEVLNFDVETCRFGLQGLTEKGARRLLGSHQRSLGVNCVWHR